MLFVTMPFTIRALQPVLMELEREQEEAAYTLGASAWTTFWKRHGAVGIAWPAHRCVPGVRPGAGGIRIRS